MIDEFSDSSSGHCDLQWPLSETRYGATCTFGLTQNGRSYLLLTTCFPCLTEPGGHKAQAIPLDEFSADGDLPQTGGILLCEGGWWRVHSLTTGRENYIPGKYVAKVYHGWLFEGLGREKAEELLQLPNTKVGSFMIRESETRKGLYSLSVRHRQVKHYRIFRLPNNWYYISPRQTFQCLEDLVNHYSEVADGLCCVLTTPCLTQCTNNNSVMNQDPPVVMRNKNFNWRSFHRLEATEDTETTLAAMDDSCLSYGLRESIASYLSLTGDDNASFARTRKKKAQSLIYTGSKHKSTLHLPPTYYED